MKKLLNLLRSERSLIGGAFGSLSDMFGWDRAVARIIGFLILWEFLIVSGPLSGARGASASSFTSDSR